MLIAAMPQLVGVQVLRQQVGALQPRISCERIPPLRAPVASNHRLVTLHRRRTEAVVAIILLRPL